MTSAAALTAMALVVTRAGASPTAYQRGVTALETGDLGGAERNLALADPHDQPDTAYLRGVVEEQRGAFAVAADRFALFLETAPTTDPRRPSAVSHQLYCLAQAGRDDDAWRLDEALPAIDGITSDGLLIAFAELTVGRRAAPEVREARLRRAAERYDRLARRGDADMVEALNGLGLARLALAATNVTKRTSELRAARDAFRQATARDARAELAFNLGAAAYALQDWALARRSFRRAGEHLTDVTLRAKAWRYYGLVCDRCRSSAIPDRRTRIDH